MTTVADVNPTEYIIGWLKAAQPYVRDDAIYRARTALADPEDQSFYLMELECLVSYTWNIQEWQVVDSRVRELHDTLTHEQIEGADWLKIAQALVAGSTEVTR